MLKFKAGSLKFRHVAQKASTRELRCEGHGVPDVSLLLLLARNASVGLRPHCVGQGQGMQKGGTTDKLEADGCAEERKNSFKCTDPLLKVQAIQETPQVSQGCHGFFFLFHCFCGPLNRDIVAVCSKYTACCVCVPPLPCPFKQRALSSTYSMCYGVKLHIPLVKEVVLLY